MRRRDRRSAGGLLPLMEARPWKDGKTVTYRYHPIGGKPINLGTDKAAAIRKVLEMNGRGDEFGTLAWVWEKYQESPRWTRLSDGTRADYRLCAKELLRVFGAMPIAAITAPMVARYVRIERRDAPIRANREKSLLSNLFAHGVDLGVCEGNPAKAVRPNVEEPRTQAVEAEVLEAFTGWLAQQSPQRRVIALMARYAALSGSRRAEFLDLTWPQVDRQAGVVRTKRAKQHGKKRGEVIELVEITDRLGDVLDQAKMLRGDNDCLYVFPTRDGNAYTARGFKAMWQRAMTDAIKAGVLQPEQRFTFHDLRAHYATEHKRARGVLPDLHKNPATTARVYDRAKEVKRRAL